MARLSASPYADRFVLKGGMLLAALAALAARRPTADVDTLTRDIQNDQDTVIAVVVEIAGLADVADGVEFLPETISARRIRDQAIYAGVRVVSPAAAIKYRFEVGQRLRTGLRRSGALAEVMALS